MFVTFKLAEMFLSLAGQGRARCWMWRKDFTGGVWCETRYVAVQVQAVYRSVQECTGVYRSVPGVMSDQVDTLHTVSISVDHHQLTSPPTGL